MKRMLCIGLVILLMGVLGLQVGAAGYAHYIYNAEGSPVGAPLAATVDEAITNEMLGGELFSSIEDIFLAPNGYLYVVDSKFNHIVVITTEGKLVRVVDSYTDEKGRKQLFNAPYGIFVDAEGNMLVADSQSAKVLYLNPQAQMILTVAAPQSDLMPDDFTFLPRKVGIDSVGRIFVISGNFNMGVLEYDSEGKFVQYMGAAGVTYSAIELLWRSFMTKNQLERSISLVPTEYNNLSVDAEDFLLVTTSELAHNDTNTANLRFLRRLNAQGTDTLSRANGNPIGDVSFDYWMKTSSSYAGPSSIVDVASLEGGAYALLDQKRGRVFAYNRDGEMLYIFGGYGEFAGALKAPTALAYADGRYYVADKGKNTVYRFETTAYARLFHQVMVARQEGRIAEEEALWQQIYHVNSNCAQAVKGQADAAYHHQDMPAAMQYYKLAGDREGYSKAYTFVRRQWIEKNFVWAAPLCVAVVCLVSWVVKRKRVFASSRLMKEVAYARHVSVRPFDGMWDLKREQRGSLRAALILLAATCLVSVLGQVFTGFLFSTTDVAAVNILVECGKILLVVAVWCICQWCVTALLDGEGTLMDIFMGTCYALFPYILSQGIALVLSNVLTANEGALYDMVLTVGMLWMAFLLVLQVKQIHDYSMKKTLLVILITFVVILLIAFVVMLILALGQQLLSVVVGLYDELSLRL